MEKLSKDFQDKIRAKEVRYIVSNVPLCGNLWFVFLITIHFSGGAVSNEEGAGRLGHYSQHGGPQDQAN